MMHLIDVTNSYRDLVQRQLAATNSQFVKVYSLGNTTVVYSETADKIEIVMENAFAERWFKDKYPDVELTSRL